MAEIDNFLRKSSEKLFADKRILALCIGGSWINKEIDEYSDLDLILITKEKLSSSKDTMYKIASSLGEIVANFTGEHVGEKRLLICLYKNPILHVDLKFLELSEFDDRIENPVIIWERKNVISLKMKNTETRNETVDCQWIEDRFWVWIHYAATKIGRGELFEALDFLSFIRTTVIGPLYQIKYGKLPRGVRKLEFRLKKEDIDLIKSTVAGYSFDSIKESIYHVIKTYKKLRNEIFPKNIKYLIDAEETSIYYLNTIMR
jgi:hypothetical protein